MTVTLQLSPETEQKLVALAEKNGQDLEAFLSHLLAIISDTVEPIEDLLSNGTTLPPPELVDKGGVHVVRAKPTGDLSNVLRREREERLDALGGLLKT